MGMNYYGPKELAAAFRTVRGNTIIIAEEIGEEHYGFRASPDSRSVAETLIHVAVMPRAAHKIHGDHVTDMANVNFMEIVGPRMALEKKPHTKAEILDLLKDDSFPAWLEAQTDEFLGERVAMPERGGGGSKSRFEMLLSVQQHEMHHRAQLMVIERMLGIKPHLTRQMEARMAAMQAARS